MVERRTNGWPASGHDAEGTAVAAASSSGEMTSWGRRSRAGGEAGPAASSTRAPDGWKVPTFPPRAGPPGCDVGQVTSLVVSLGTVGPVSTVQGHAPTC